MNKGQKTKNRKCGRPLTTEAFDRRSRLQKDRDREAENRRKLLAKLSPEAREFAIREFAKLGLTQ